MRAQNELLDAIQILIDKSMADRSTRITGGAVKSASGGLATVTINGYDYSIPYSGTAPTIGSTVRVFIPNGNMSDAFIGGGGGGGSTGTTNYNNLTNKPSINGTTLSGNKTSTELGVYGTGNEPPYPVTSVNGQTGAVTINTDGKVTSVNGQTGDVVLNAESVGALPSTTKIPSATSDLTNDSGYITAAGAPVQSVDGQTGDVVTNAVKTTAQTLTDAQKAQARTNIGAGTSSFSGAYDDLTGKPPIPSKTSELDNDSGFITDAALTPYAKTVDVPTKTSQLNNDSGFVDAAGASAAAPVQSVNTKTGAVVLGASDIGAVSIADVTQTLGSSTTKVPSEKAVADALSGAGAGDMLKATYDPTGSVAQAGGIPDYVAGQLPTVNDATLTIQKNGTAVGTFTANASVNKSINITMAKGDVGLSNVDNVKQYSADNPPPYPVTSVNGKTGAVNLDIPTLPDNLVKYNALSPVEATTPVNADTLQGHAANYFATASGLSAVEQSVDGKLDKAGGTMLGALIAQANTNYATAQVRNVIISPNDPSGGNSGDIWIKYVE